MPNWDKRFLKEAKEVSKWSKDSSTQVGCILVRPDRRSIVATGYNGLPRGCDDNVESHPERHTRPADGGNKYAWYEHAERNAIYNAAYDGVSTAGCTAYVTSSLPCVDCARALVQAGIKRVVWELPNDPEFAARWADSIKVTEEIFFETGVKTTGIGSY